MPSIHDPLVQSSILPFLASVIVIGLMRFALGSGKTAPVAGIGVGVGIFFVTAFILGLPGFPPAGASQKFLYVAGGATIVAVLYPTIKNGRPILLSAAIIPAVWIAWPAILQARIVDLMPVIATVAILSVTAYRASENETASTGLLATLLVSLAALSIVALQASAASVGQAAAVGAASIGGFLVWNWPRRRHLPLVALIPALATTSSLGTQSLLYTSAQLWPLAIVLAAAAAFWVSYSQARSTAIESPMKLVITTVGAAVLVAIPVITMIATQPQSSGY